MNVLVVGGSGFVGRHVVGALRSRGDTVAVTGRDEARLRQVFPSGVRCVGWDPLSGPLPASALDGVDGVVNLAGEPVLGWWTARKRAGIRGSRVAGTRNLVEGIAGSPRKPRVLVNASAIGYYGDAAHRALHETSPPATDFLGE
ncbi:MAG: NAD-dependent epimerase/dehydratase family protein, partial [Planctomycetota bacterium]